MEEYDLSQEPKLETSMLDKKDERLLERMGYLPYKGCYGWHNDGCTPTQVFEDDYHAWFAIVKTHTPLWERK
jgi:hypothetical protein